MSEEVSNVNKESEEINIQELLFKYLAYWKWFVISLIVCLVVSFFYLRYTTPVYNVSAAIIIKDEKKGGNSSGPMAMFEGLGMLGGTNNFDNELEILKSKSLIKSVVASLGLHTSYQSVNVFSTVDLYGKSPLVVSIDPAVLDTISKSITFNAQINLDKSLNVEGKIYGKEIKTTLHSLPAVLKTPAGNLNISYNPKIQQTDGVIQVSIKKPMLVAKSYLGLLSVAPTSKTTSVINLSLLETNRKRGEDFIALLIKLYNKDAIADKNKVAENTKTFIDDRIALIDKELGAAEHSAENYKRSQKLTDLKSDAQLYLEKSSEYEKNQVEVETQLNLVTYLQKYISNKGHRYSLVPSNVGLTDRVLMETIGEYNKSILERDRMLRTASESNPSVLAINGKIDALRGNVATAVNSVRQGLVIAKQDVDSKMKLYKDHIENVPTQEREFTEIARQQQIKSNLFLLLLQKREENALSLAVTENKAKVIDEPMASDAPVSPKRPIIYLVALLLGLIIPIVIIYVKDLLQYTITSRADVEKLSNLALLGEIPTNEEEGDMAVKENSNTPIAEAFRSLRTNILFILGGDKKVILFTSTLAGEGKSFVSTNTAISLALMNKKVLLIGLDVRKPRLAECLGLHPTGGITTYLSGAEPDLNKLIIPSGIHSLDVLTAGAIPPNPAELLMKKTLDQAIEKLREQYDYIVIDSAPVGLVSDTLILNRVADMTVYVCRAHYSHKKNLKLANELSEQNKLKNLSLVVNGIDLNQISYGYGYGHEVDKGKEWKRRIKRN